MFRTPPIVRTTHNNKMTPNVQTSHKKIEVDKKFLYQISVFMLTYLAYTSYHMSRKPISVVKSSPSFLQCEVDVTANISICTSWISQLNGEEEGNARQMLGLLDTTFLLSYAGSMFLSGMLADKIDLRYFLSIGMVMSGLLTVMFGFGQLVNIHNLWFFICVQLASGVFQSSGWPGVVTVMANWFGKGKRGLVMGLWNSHTSMGNMLGSLLAGYFVTGSHWGLAFIFPGLVLVVAGVIIHFCLVSHPEHINQDEKKDMYEQLEATETKSLLKGTPNSFDITDYEINENGNAIDNDASIGFWKAVKIPGVVEFSLCLFFAKLVSYTFLYWLPNYIHLTSGLGPEDSANLSTVFDVGGIIGAILAGVLSDKSGKPATICSLMLGLTLPLLFTYQHLPITVKDGSFVPDSSLYINITVLLATGAFVNGPYALISTAVSAELSQHPSLSGSNKALSIVTAVIDGTGSIGAAVGPFLAGWLSGSGDWSRVFQFLMSANCLALVFLVRQMKNETMPFLRRLIKNKSNVQYGSSLSHYNTFA